MPKIKTHKATAKRVKITKKDKIRARKAGQGHFNARETGRVKRDKRNDITTGMVSKKVLKTLMPY